MTKTTFRRQSRIPPEAQGIQVNHCKSPGCQNYGIPATESRRAAADGMGSYLLTAAGRKLPVITCRLCRHSSVLSSNVAIYQEMMRFDPAALRVMAICCQTEDCGSNGLPVDEFPSHYYRHGKTRSGQLRFRCKACGQTISSGMPIRKQRRPELNGEILRLIVNKIPMRRICEVLALNPATLYNKLRYLAEVATEHIQKYERTFVEGDFTLRRAYISVDRQDHLLNWGSQVDRRYTTLGAVGAIENVTGYILALQLNFDADCNPQDVEADAIAAGDYEVARAYRRHARLWLRKDYDHTQDPADPLEPVPPPTDSKPPTQGMQVYLSDMQYGLFFHLRKLLRNTEKIRFFLDRDPGLDNACLAAFIDRIKLREVDAFVIQGKGKDATVDKKKLKIAQANNELEKFAKQAGLTDMELARQAFVVHHLKRHRSATEKAAPFDFPLSDMAEPGKLITYLTDFQDYEIEHLARLYRKTTLRGVDRVFMQIRRRLSILERPIATASSARRAWHGYAAYSPIVVQQVLQIFRAYYNFALLGEGRKTPAMRLGILDTPISIEALAERPTD